MQICAWLGPILSYTNANVMPRGLHKLYRHTYISSNSLHHASCVLWFCKSAILNFYSPRIWFEVTMYKVVVRRYQQIDKNNYVDEMRSGQIVYQFEGYLLIKDREGGRGGARGAMAPPIFLPRPAQKSGTSSK